MMYPEIMPRWHEMAQTLADNNIDPFDPLEELLEQLDMTTNQANAMFLYDYYNAELIEDDYRRISMLIEMVAIDNARKYQTLIEDYPFAEMRKRVRSPNLTKSVNGGSNTNTTVSRNQTEKQTETPKNDFGQTRTHSVSPYDSNNNDFKSEYKDAVVNTGSREIETTYTGEPDETETHVKANTKETETGTETITETITGNAKQTMSEAMQDIGQAATIWQIIEKDIAKKIFIQIWR